MPTTPVHLQTSGLASALFSQTQQRVIGLLFGQPSRSFYAAELIAMTQGGSGAIQRELARLTAAGLLTVEQHGHQKHYRANRQSPIFAELCGIAQKTIGLADPLRAALQPLADRIHAAFIYGSVAKRQDTSDSDIDLMILANDIGYADLFDLLEPLNQQWQRTINPTIYTPADWQQRLQRGDAFVTRVWAQPKVWLLGDENACADGAANDTPTSASAKQAHDAA